MAQKIQASGIPEAAVINAVQTLFLFFVCYKLSGSGSDWG